MKKLFLACVVASMALGFTSCDEDDEKIMPKDYGMKTFEADMGYDPNAGGGPSGGVSYTKQTLMKLSENDGYEAVIHTGTHGEDSWINYNLYTDDSAYNVTTDVSGWDLAFTYYKTPILYGESIINYGVSGVLVNTDNNIKVAMMTDSVSTDLTLAFSELTLEDVGVLQYSTDMDAIGYGWKDAYNGLVHSNRFYIVKKSEDEIYKVRFVSMYGETKDVRIFKIEYALMAASAEDLSYPG